MQRKDSTTRSRKDSFVHRFSRSRSSSLKARFSHRKASTASSSSLSTFSSIRLYYEDMLLFPVELHASILCQISFADLCAFRAVCTTFARLVSSGEIVRKWLEVNAEPQILYLYPPPSPTTFAYALDCQWQWTTAVETAKTLAGFIEKDVLRRTLERLDVFPERPRREVFAMVTGQVEAALVPLVITVQHYLAWCGRLILGGEPSLYETRVKGNRRMTERELLESYDPEHLLQVHKFWLFLCWLCNHILTERPDALTAPIQGHASPRELFSRTRLRLMIVLGNLTALRGLLQVDTPKNRIRAIGLWYKRLDPELSLLWRRGWRENVTVFDVPRGPVEALTILSKSLSMTQVWVETATAVLIDRGLLPRKARIEVPGTPWQALDFLCDVAGYDAMQDAPSLAPSSPPRNWIPRR